MTLAILTSLTWGGLARADATDGVLPTLTARPFEPETGALGVDLLGGGPVTQYDQRLGGPLLLVVGLATRFPAWSTLLVKIRQGAHRETHRLERRPQAYAAWFAPLLVEVHSACVPMVIDVAVVGSKTRARFEIPFACGE